MSEAVFSPDAGADFVPVFDSDPEEVSVPEEDETASFFSDGVCFSDPVLSDEVFAALPL